MSTACKILATVNAPYGADMSACALANAIADMGSLAKFDASVFSFFSEVAPARQRAFIREMGVDKDAVAAVASGFEKLAGYKLALAA